MTKVKEIKRSDCRVGRSSTWKNTDPLHHQIHFLHRVSLSSPCHCHPFLPSGPSKSDSYPDATGSHRNTWALRQLPLRPSLSCSTNKGSNRVLYPTVKSQPIPNHYTWESKADDIAYTIFSLANFAHGNACLFYWIQDRITNSSLLARETTATTLDTPKNIQPPEALTGGKIGLQSDVWALGCTVSVILIPTLLLFGTHAHRWCLIDQTYLLLTGKPLFDKSYVASPVKVTQETLGKLESLLTESANVTEKDIASTAKFLRTCLAVNIANK